MTTDQVRACLRQHEDELRALGVSSLEVFGSTVRDEARPDSDVDLLVLFSRRIGLIDFFTVQHRLEDMLGVTHVDLVDRTALKPALRDHILAEAVRVA